MTPHLTSAGLGLLLGLGILWLVRRDRLHGNFALWWLTVAVASLAVGFFPASVDWLGRAMGVAYPPMLLVLVALVAMLLKLLGVDIDATHRERRLRRLLQKVAILELEIRELRTRLEQDPPSSSLSATDARPSADQPGDGSSPSHASAHID